jgi:ketosteroid isomerase-like protein
MRLTREHAREILGTYIRAWETQDPDLICTIFTPAATYHERVLAAPIPDRDAIRAYWAAKVVREQANITCELAEFYVDAERDTLIAEWEAWFDDLVKDERKHMKEIAVLTFEDGLVSSLREYWASERLALRPPQLGRAIGERPHGPQGRTVRRGR